LKVYSFPRSGTHFLLALLWTNYHTGNAPNPAPAMARPDDPPWMHARRWLGPKGFCPWRHLFGGHRPWAGQSSVLFILRHPYATLASLHRLIQSPLPLGEFLCSTSRAARLHWIYDADLPMPVFWLRHAASYLGGPTVQRRILAVVRYEDLVAGRGLPLTACPLPWPRRTGKFQPVTERVGWSPSTEQTGEVDVPSEVVGAHTQQGRHPAHRDRAAIRLPELPVGNAVRGDAQLPC